MKRKIIHIDQDRCIGCGMCAEACHEGAIEMVDGKARLTREDFCDGFGDCLPECPAGAISFEEREAPAYDAAAVRESREKKEAEKHAGGPEREGGCPGSKVMRFSRESREDAGEQPVSRPVSRLGQWPCQIRLVPEKAPFLDGARLLIAADCTAYACAAMHEEFMKGRITLIGCPKLDPEDYTGKLAAILQENDIRSVTVVRMEVPCCGGLQRAAENAIRESGKMIPWRVVTVTLDGNLLEE